MNELKKALTDEDWQAIADDADLVIWSRMRQAVDRRLAALSHSEPEPPSQEAREAASAQTMERAKIDRHALAHLRHVLHGWHEDVVALGMDGVATLIDAAKVAKRRAELVTVDGAVKTWRQTTATQAELWSALNAMVTFFGMDEDETSKPTFDVARTALAASVAEKPAPQAAASLHINGSQLRDALMFADNEPEVWLVLTKREAFTSTEGDAMEAGIYAHLADYPEEGVYGPLDDGEPSLDSTPSEHAEPLSGSRPSEQEGVALPVGWVMVPLVPTQQMCQQGQWKAREWPKFPLRIGPIYRAMLEAAPKPPSKP